MTVRSRLYAVAFHSDLQAARFMLAAGAILIGVGFLWPSQLFPDPSNIAPGARATYLYMAMMAPEWAWGLAFFAQGCVMLWSLLQDRTGRALLWCDAVFGCLLWTSSIMACYAAYWPGLENVLDYKPPAIMGGELAAMFGSWWVLVRYTFNSKKGGVK